MNNQPFLDLLHEAQQAEARRQEFIRLLSKIRTYVKNSEDLKIADSMKDYWKCSADGAER